MAMLAPREIKGEYISGPGTETIIPAHLTVPNPIEYGQYAANIPFTHIQRDANNDEKAQMQNSGCSYGSLWKYDEDINGQAKSATFSWWSVYLNDDARNMVMQKKKPDWKINDFFQGMPIYGNNRLILPLDRMMEVYRDSSRRVPVVRILGTYKNNIEWMHAFVITPYDDLTFQNHQFAAFVGFDGRLAWNPNVPVTANMDTYQWNAFSTVEWDNSRPDYSKERNCNHLSFAFHLDPLPEKVLRYQEQDIL